ncbi:MAG TPA: hypothetical protein VI299_04900 [Polyangiales bacterium]
MKDVSKQIVAVGMLWLVACGGDDAPSTQLRTQDVAEADCAEPARSVLTPRVMTLWPPNHKLHTISVEDCVGVYDACDPEVTAEFIWGSSDEPVDSIGDGHHEPDIIFEGCDRVQLRSERQGPKDGRVYKLGVRAVDGAGNVTLGACTVVVDHDQRGVLGADSGESYRVTLDGTGGMPLCNGAPDASVREDASLGDGAVSPPAVPDAGAPGVIGI